MSAPVPDIDELILEMEVLHQQCVRNGIPRQKKVDSFMESLESLDLLSDQDKLLKPEVQRRIMFLKRTPTSSFANGGEISEALPVQSMSNSPGPLHVKQESAQSADGFAGRIPAVTEITHRIIFVSELFNLSSFSDGGAFNICANIKVIVSNYQIYMPNIKAKDPGYSDRE
jgi:hypothetical protein